MGGKSKRGGGKRPGGMRRSARDHLGHETRTGIYPRVRLRAGMVASRLVPVEHAIPALTDHSEDTGGVIGP
jgi:hypothetical protein